MEFDHDKYREEILADTMRSTPLWGQTWAADSPVRPYEQVLENVRNITTPQAVNISATPYPDNTYISGNTISSHPTTPFPTPGGQNNVPFVPAPRADYGYAYGSGTSSPPPSGYGDFRDQQLFAAKQFIAGVFALAQANSPNFVDLPYEGAWCLQKPGGKTTAIADIVIIKVWTVYSEELNTPIVIWIKYSTKYGGCNLIFDAVIPAEELPKRKVLRYFSHIRKKPRCPDGLLQDLIYWLLQQYQSMGIIVIPRHSGWTAANGRLEFCADRTILSQLAEYYPQAAKQRQLPRMTMLQPDIIQKVNNLCATDWRIGFLVAMNAMSILYPFVMTKTNHPRQIILLENAGLQNADKVVALLKTERYDNLSVHSADSPPTTIRRILADTNDSVALFRDSSPIDQSRKLQCTLGELIKDTQNVGTSNVKSRHLITLISDYAAAYTEPENIIRLNVETLQINAAAKDLELLIENFDALLIKTRLESSSGIWDSIMSGIKGQDETDGADEIFDGYRELLYGVLVTHCIVSKLLGIALFNSESAAKLTELFRRPTDTFDTAEAICKEFSAILSRKIRKNELLLVKKNDTMRFSDDDPNHYAISFNENICIPVDTFNEVIMPRLNKVSTIRTLLSALRERDFLYATKHNFLPLDVFTSGGHYQSLKTIAISARLLEADIREKVDGLGTEGYSQNATQMPRCFLPLIQVQQKKVAGRLIIPANADNNHVFVTGDSGIGKSYALAQIAASFAEIGPRVLVFDTSGSFATDALYRNLPSDYVDKNVQFHKIEDSKIPVDLFDVRDFKTRIQKRNAISGILCASELVLGPQQENILKNALDTIVNADSTTLNPSRLIHELRQIGSKSAVTLLTRLEPMLEEMSEYEMLSSTWSDFLKQARPITIISMKSTYTSSGYKLVDMLIASLYNHKIYNPESQITVMLDEMQNQNLDAESPIAKIMREGRKLNIAMVGATQEFRLSGEKVANVMRHADTRLFLKPTIDSEEYVAKALRWGKKQAAYFDRMERGDCIVSGPLYDHLRNRNIQTILLGQVCKFEPIPEWRKQH